MIRHFTIVTIAAAVALLLAASPVLPCDAGDVHVDPFFCAQWGFPPNDTECIRHALTLLPPISNNNTVNTVYLASFTAWNGRCEFVLPARTQLTGNLISPNAVHIYCSNSTYGIWIQGDDAQVIGLTMLGVAGLVGQSADVGPATLKPGANGGCLVLGGGTAEAPVAVRNIYLSVVVFQYCNATRGGLMWTAPGSSLNVTSLGASYTHASSDGGGFFLGNGTVMNIDNVAVGYHFSGRDGGFLYGSSGVRVVGSDLSLAYSQAAGNGGHVALYGGPEGLVSMGYSDIITGTSGGDGGSIYVDSGAVVVFNSTFLQCAAMAGVGGAVAVGNSGGARSSGLAPVAVFNVSGCAFSQCVAGSGGGAVAAVGAGAFAKVDSVYFVRNEVGKATGTGFGGGAVLVSDRALAEVFDAIFVGNSAAPAGDSCVLGPYGGAVAARSGAEVVLTSPAMFANLACDGGALAAFNASLRVAGAMVVGNTAVNGGGALYAEGGQAVVVVSSSFLRLNRAEAGSGGAVLAWDSVSLYLTAVAASFNSAASNGGALIAVQAALINATDLVLTMNAASIQGGGACLAGNVQVRWDGFHLVNNTAAEGGGLWISRFDTSKTATLREGVFVNNTGGIGGGMMVDNAGGNAMDGAAVSIINTIFEDNTAASDATGGAIACTGSPKPTIDLFGSIVEPEVVGRPKDGVFTALDTNGCHFGADNKTRVVADIPRVSPVVVPVLRPLGKFITFNITYLLPSVFNFGIEYSYAAVGGQEATELVWDGKASVLARLDGNGGMKRDTSVGIYSSEYDLFAYSADAVATSATFRVTGAKGGDIFGKGGTCLRCDESIGCETLFCAVQVASRAAVFGNLTVAVAPGEYGGNIVAQAPMKIVATRGPGSVVVSCQASPAWRNETGISLVSTADGMVLDGVTVTGCGVGLSILGAATIRDVKVINNGFLENGPVGGGIVVSTGPPATRLPSFDNVVVESNTAAFGGGMVIDMIFRGGQRANLTWTLSGITFVNNTATVGGALYLYVPYPLKIALDRLVFAGNSAGYGGAVATDLTDVFVTRTTVANNSAFWGGAGFYLRTAKPSATLLEISPSTTTIAGNRVTGCAVAVGPDCSEAEGGAGATSATAAGRGWSPGLVAAYPSSIQGCYNRSATALPLGVDLSFSAVLLDVYGSRVCGPNLAGHLAVVDCPSSFGASKTLAEHHAFDSGTRDGRAWMNGSFNALATGNISILSVTDGTKVPPLAHPSTTPEMAGVYQCAVGCSPDACVPGRWQPGCLACDSGFGGDCSTCVTTLYGPSCNLTTTCLHGVPTVGNLNADNRGCSSCHGGWLGSNCDTCSSMWIGAGCNLPLLAVIGVPVALVLGAAAAIAVWWSRRVRKAAASRDHYSEVETLLGSRTRDDGGVGPEDFHELSVLSTASLDDFRVVRSIAAGANGQIFEAKCLIGQAPGDRSYALKIIFNYGVLSDQMRNRYGNEYLVLSRLPPHKNIVRFFAEISAPIPDQILELLPPLARELAVNPDTRRVRTAQFLVMEFVGETLECHVDGWEYPAPWSAVAPLALDLVSAVEWLYFHHVVHLDHKFNNILVEELAGSSTGYRGGSSVTSHASARSGRTHRAVLCDFGCAQFCDTQWRTESNNVLLDGNQAHKAPEVLNGLRSPSGRIVVKDQPSFALGMLLYRLAAGCSPYEDYPIAFQNSDGLVELPEDRPSIRGAFRSLTTSDEVCPRDFDAMVTGLLEADPAVRTSVGEAYATMLDVTASVLSVWSLPPSVLADSNTTVDNFSLSASIN